MATLENGFHLRTEFHRDLTVNRLLGEGGQGEVYHVTCNGQPAALKWYKKDSLKNPEAFRENLRQNIMRGAPSREFLWPLDLTGWERGSFGYVMDLRPEGYYDITDFTLCHVRFPSYKAVIDACLSIVSAFRILHNDGYSYQDLNDGNFFINPRNGKVLIGDNDNVAPDKTETGIVGKPRYMAPEIVLRKNMPDSLSDRFSMSVILYMLFCLNHPLEGQRYLVPALTPALEEKLYGSEALFMMDPDDHANAPNPAVHGNSIKVWGCLPDYMRKIFLDAFSRKALEKPSARPSEAVWLNTLTRFRSDIVPCTCGNEIFTRDGKPCKCEKCGRPAQIPFRLQFSQYAIPAVRGSRIYRCQLGICDAKDALSPVGMVVAKENRPGVLGIRNKSDRRWDAVTTKGEVRKVAPDETIPLKDGIRFTACGENIEILSN